MYRARSHSSEHLPSTWPRIALSASVEVVHHDPCITSLCCWHEHGASWAALLLLPRPWRTRLLQFLFVVGRYLQPRVDVATLISKRVIHRLGRIQKFKTSAFSHARTHHVRPRTFAHARTHSTTDKISACAFVSCARSCQVEVGFANYLRLPACVLHDSKPELTALLLLLWLLVLFVVLVRLRRLGCRIDGSSCCPLCCMVIHARHIPADRAPFCRPSHACWMLGWIQRWPLPVACSC